MKYSQCSTPLETGRSPENRWVPGRKYRPWFSFPYRPQLNILLNLINQNYIFGNPIFEIKENDSGIFESRFVSVNIQESRSIFLKHLEGMTLGIWVAHKEGKYVVANQFPVDQIPIRYSDSQYPFNPNGSDCNIAAICSRDGRHLSMMPHPERSIFTWQCGFYPYFGMIPRLGTPWINLFFNALIWCETKGK